MIKEIDVFEGRIPNIIISSIMQIADTNRIYYRFLSDKITIITSKPVYMNDFVKNLSLRPRDNPITSALSSKTTIDLLTIDYDDEPYYDPTEYRWERIQAFYRLSKGRCYK